MVTAADGPGKGLLRVQVTRFFNLVCFEEKERRCAHRLVLPAGLVEGACRQNHQPYGRGRWLREGVMVVFWGKVESYPSHERCSHLPQCQARIMSLQLRVCGLRHRPVVLRRGSDPRGIESMLRSLHNTWVWELEEMNAEVVVITLRQHKSAK